MNSIIKQIGQFIIILSLYSYASIDQTHTITANIDVHQHTLNITQTIEWTNTSTTPTNTIYIRLNNSKSEKNPHVSDVINDAHYIQSFQPSRHAIHSIKQNNTPLTHEYVNDEGLRKMSKFATDKNLVKVTLLNEVKPNKHIKIKLESSKKIPTAYQLSENYVFRGVTTLRFNWYPLIANTLIEKPHKNYNKLPRHRLKKLTLSTNQKTTIGLSSSTFKSETSTNNTTVTATWEYPLHGVGISLSNRYKTLSKNTSNNKTTLNVLYLDKTTPEQAQKILDNATTAYDYFTKTYGELPYTTIIISNAPIPNVWGMAINGHIFLGNSLFSPNTTFEQTHLNRIHNYIIAHEIAHLWSGFDMNFGHNNALSEGLTEYLNYNFLDTLYGPGTLLLDKKNEYLFLMDPLYNSTIVNRLKNYRYHAIKEYQQSLKYNWDEPLSYPFEKSNTSAKQTKDYQKSSLFFSSLETYIGTKNMTAALKKYTHYNNPNRSYKSLEKFISLSSTKNITPFFNAWAFKPSTIDFSIANKITQKQQSSFKSTLTIEKKGPAPASLPIKVTYLDQSSSDHLLTDPKATSTLTLHHQSPIKKIALDPNMMLLETNRFNNFYPHQTSTYTLANYLGNDTTPLAKHKATDEYQLYLFTPYILSTPSLFPKASLFGFQIKGKKYLDHEWRMGIGLNPIDNYENMTLFTGYTHTISKETMLSGLIQYDFQHTLQTDIGMIHPIYETITTGYYGTFEAPLSTLSYGLTQKTSLTSKQTTHNLFFSWAYQNLITQPALANIRIETAPSGLISPSFTSMTSSYQYFHKMAPQLLLAPKITLGTGKNSIEKFSEETIRGVSSSDKQGDHMMIGSLNLLFPILKFGDGIPYFIGKLIGINGNLFYEYATLPSHLLHLNATPYQSIGIEFGFANTVILDMPLSLSLGYAQTIASPRTQDSEIYFDLGIELNVFHQLYTY